MTRRILLLVAAGVLLASCTGDTPGETTMGMPNPASVYCEEQGGTVEMREAEGGTQGFCVFPDGGECDEWEFYRGECAPGGGDDGRAGLPNPAAVYCIEQGGTLEDREVGGGTQGFCVFDDGSECDEWAYYRGECAPAG
jgi:hypothetical protein